MAKLKGEPAAATTPDFDEAVTQDDESLTVVNAIRQNRDEADWAKQSRMSQNQKNRDTYLGRQDWSHKIEGQSKEFLPKTGVSVEQMTAFIKRGLLQFGDWFSIDVDQMLERMVSGQQLATFLNAFLHNLWGPNGSSNHIATVISDAVKVGMLESMMIFKVHGGYSKKRTFKAERGNVNLLDSGAVEKAPDTLATEEEDEWRLRVDLIRGEDYYPDPTGIFRPSTLQLHCQPQRRFLLPSPIQIHYFLLLHLPSPPHTIPSSTLSTLLLPLIVPIPVLVTIAVCVAARPPFFSRGTNTHHWHLGQFS